MESQVIRGLGSTIQVAALLDRLKVSRLLLVRDDPAYGLSGAEAALAKCWQGREVATFAGFQLNPKLEDIERGVALARRLRPEVVIAVGGGSAIDIAKVIAACGSNEGAPAQYISGEETLNEAGPPLIAIPTTAGTGSEATHFAVAYIGATKYSLAHPGLLPQYAILDAELTLSLPPVITAATGLDALCQAIESMWAVGGTEDSRQFAEQSFELAWQHLPIAVKSPTPEGRQAMLDASHLAGKAINIGKTTAPHAISYALTTRYGTPHGMAVALTLPAVLRHNHEIDEASCTDPRGVAQVRASVARILTALGCDSAEQAQAALEQFIAALDCPTRLSQIGAEEADLPEIAAAVNVERLGNNPRRISQAELVAILREVL
ncbi:MAG: phosphonoacetaldehyde reductase [Pirellulaceae bacterium]